MLIAFLIHLHQKLVKLLLSFLINDKLRLEGFQIIESSFKIFLSDSKTCINLIFMSYQEESFK
jgi:hypothetical protein